MVAEHQASSSFVRAHERDVTRATLVAAEL
jgi:hypothetical protein